ncbi:MAG: type IV secretory system conjugative DNA transfer family protein [Eubacteriales bacterium]
MIFKKIGLGAFLVVLLSTLLGGFITMGMSALSSVLKRETFEFFKPEVFLKASTYGYGFVALALCVICYFALSRDMGEGKSLLRRKAKAVVGALENSRFLLDKERDELFPRKKFTQLNDENEDGIALYGVYNQKKKELDINLCAPAHGLIIGATGSGKTTTFINPVVQILGHTSAGSSMICTDPKGELFQMHSKMLKERGYNVMVLDLRDPYSSYRWNPLGEIYDRYQVYAHKGDNIYERTDNVKSSGLEILAPLDRFGDVWYEFEGKAYADGRVLYNYVRVEKQKIYDELYEDLNDLISVLCPIESADDPVWEKGARSIVLATCLAMLEDSEDPKLEMTKDKFCFYNVSKAISNSENEFEALKRYFDGRSKLSKAVGISRQVVSAADQTLSSYMSIAFDKLAMFNDEGLCALTADTDIDPSKFGDEPTALFLKIPDEKDTRHALAGVFILSIYKALIKVASAREDLSLPRNVYFLLDEFGNMPKIDKFDKMITVGRSRKIWFHMVVQSYAQLNNVYSDTVADIVKSNCGIKMFIGSNDIATCEEFSKLCGNMTVSTSSVSGAVGGSQGVNYSSQIQERPLIYPSELMKLNNKKDTGNAIIVTFGNHPLRTKFTPSYRCPLYEFGQMDLTDVRNNVFFGDQIFYDLDERNYLILDGGAEEAEAEAAVEPPLYDVPEPEQPVAPPAPEYVPPEPVYVPDELEVGMSPVATLEGMPQMPKYVRPEMEEQREPEYENQPKPSTDDIPQWDELW